MLSGLGHFETMQSIALARRVSSLFPKRSLSRFLSVGFLNTIVGVSVFPALFWIWGPGAHVNAILAISYVVCTLFAFASHRVVTFRSQGRVRVEGTRFLFVSGATYLLNVGLLNASLPLVPSHPIALQIGIALTLQIFNFFILSRIVFPPPAEKRKS